MILYHLGTLCQEKFGFHFGNSEEGPTLCKRRKTVGNANSMLKACATYRICLDTTLIGGYVVAENAFWRHRMFRHSFRYTVFAQICLAIFLLTGRAFAQATNDAGTGPKEGDKCKVTAGTNKGQVGKYTT